MKNKIRVLLCGVIFGQVYLKGVLNNSDYQLCGILSTGSEYSRKIAAKYHVSLYTKIDEVSSDNFDLALVVIRSGIVGGEGNKVTQQLLNKGIFYNFKNIDRQGGVLLSWRRMEYSRMA